MNYQHLLTDFSQLARRFEERILDILPKLVGALAIMLAGLALAFLLRFLVRRLVGGLDRIIPGQKVKSSLRRLGMERSAADVIGGVVYWIVLIFFLTAATETLGLPVVTTWLSGIALYLPRILSGVLICFAGLIGGILLRDLTVSAAASAGIAYGSALGRLAQGATLLISVLIAVEQVGINVDFLTTTAITLLGIILFGGSLAFGLGARTVVSNILAAHYLQKVYAVGQQVRIGEWQGEIVQITATAVILETAEGRVLVPAKLFGETASVLVTKGY